MKIKYFEKDIYVCRTAAPVFLKGSGKAILGIHGYNGYVEDLRYLAEQLNSKGFTVFLPRLPGHGTNASDFLNSNSDDWLRRTIDAYLDLKSEYNEVNVFGLSMGGVLALVLASMFDIKKLVLYAPAITANNRFLKFAQIMKYFIKKKPRNWQGKIKDKFDEHLAAEYWRWHYLKPAAELYKLQKLCRNRLDFVESEILSFVSESDEQVPLNVNSIIRLKAPKSNLHEIKLKNSPHAMTSDVDKEFIAKETVKFFSNK